MTVQPTHHSLRAGGFPSVRQGGAVDHDHRQAKTARRGDLGVGRRAACIFGNNKVDVVVLHQPAVRRFIERASVQDHMGVGQGKRSGRRVHQTQQVEMLRSRSEISQMHTSDGQHDATGRPIERGDRSLHIGNMLPAVSVCGGPGWTRQRDQWHICGRAGGNGISAHLCGERVGRIDDMRDTFLSQVRAQPGHAAKAANALRQRLTFRPCHAPGKRYRALQSGGGSHLGKGGRFGCAAKDQEVGCDG